jgi:glyoxylase-like metal-dependent hydrolase (beta-lactamase superfamily II)/rhodanese-related sulfurtransferase
MFHMTSVGISCRERGAGIMGNQIDAHELHGRMASLQGVTILDVRNHQAYEDWRIQGNHVQSLNVPNSQLQARGVDACIDVPKNREIVAVCAQGIAAQETVKMLEEAGFKSAYLEGGMGSWAEYYYPVRVAKLRSGAIYQVIRPGKGCLSYLVTSGAEAVVVDAGRHVQTYLDLAEEIGVSIRHTVDTHMHADHISGSRNLARKTGATYWIAAEEMVEASGEFHALEDGMTLPIGSDGLEMLSIRTPGHTVASTSFLIDGSYLLSGDTIFVSGLGRPDLKGKAYEMAEEMYDTVIHKLSSLDGATLVLPSHYSDYREITSEGYVGARLEDIKARNVLLSVSERKEFVESLVRRVGATPPNYEKVTQVNRGLYDAPWAEQSELEIGPNRCAVRP